MAGDINGIMQNIEARLNSVQRGYNQAIQQNDSKVDLILKTAGAAFAAGLFAGIAGASFGTILFVTMITAAAVGAYVASTYDPVSARGIANNVRAGINDFINDVTSSASQTVRAIRNPNAQRTQRS